MTKRKQKPFSAFQNAVKLVYGGGDYAHHTTVAEYEDAGDTLYVFIMRELADDGGPMDRATAVTRLQSAIQDLTTVQAAIDAMPN